MKDERELLTRKRIAERLAWEAKHSILGTLIVCGMAALLLTILVRLIIPRTYAALAWLAVVPCLIAFTLSLVRSLMQLDKIRREKFIVVEDILIDVQTDQLNRRRAFLSGEFRDPSNIWNLVFGNRWYDRDCYEHIFQFQSGRRFVANAHTYHGTRLETVAEFSMRGDTFFLVMYENAPKKIVLLYSSKIYRYTEEHSTRV